MFITKKDLSISINRYYFINPPSHKYLECINHMKADDKFKGWDYPKVIYTNYFK